MGFIVIERLTLEGREIPFDFFPEKMGPSTKEMLKENLCAPCPFYEDDCDFVQQKGEPCGGFLLLGRLLETRAICIDNIRDVG